MFVQRIILRNRNVRHRLELLRNMLLNDVAFIKKAIKCYLTVLPYFRIFPIIDRL